jgi:hypothetical protein
MAGPATWAPSQAGAIDEIERLRTMLDRQPACLMRIAEDGTLLAINDAALSLLGVRELADALDTSIVARIQSPDAATVWTDFSARVSSAGAGSLECQMRDAGGVQRAVILQAVTLPHPDGEASLLVTARDVTTARKLQDSLEQVASALAQLRGALGTAIDATLLAQQVVEKGQR